MNERSPETAAELFDLCHRLFGIGNYDEYAHTDPPWFKVRANEIGKLKRILRARRIEVRSMAMAAEYCHRHGITITATGELIPYIVHALVEHRAEQSTANTRDLYDRINHAAEVAIEQGDTDLAERITRIPFAAAAEALPAIEQQLGIA